MTELTPGDSADEVAMAEALLASVRRRLIELRDELEDLKQRVSAGEEVDGTAAAKALGQISEVINRCHKAEMMVYDCTNKQSGIARGGYALDLGQARADIGCKLDRLRCAIDSGEVPE